MALVHLQPWLNHHNHHPFSQPKVGVEDTILLHCAYAHLDKLGGTVKVMFSVKASVCPGHRQKQVDTPLASWIADSRSGWYVKIVELRV